MPPTLDLSKLRLGFDFPQAINDGFSILQVKSLALLSPDNRLKLDCTAMVASDRRCVTELIQDAIPDVISLHWTVVAAQINLYYPPEIGKSRSKVVSVEVTRKGRLNLHKFDAAMQSRLEGYLVALGVLGVGQPRRVGRLKMVARGRIEPPTQGFSTLIDRLRDTENQRHTA